MPANVGYKTIVKIQVGSVSTLTAIGQGKSADISTQSNIYDVTIFGDQWKDILPGINDYSIKIMCNMDMTDAVQLALFNAWVAGTLITWSIQPLGSGGTFSGTGYLKSLPFKFGVNAVEDAEFDIDGSGPLTYA